MAQPALAEEPTKRARKYPGRNIHMYWPFALGDRIERLAEKRAMSMTDIVIRVLAHADANQLLEQWITEPPPGLSPSETKEGATGK